MQKYYNQLTIKVKESLIEPLADFVATISDEALEIGSDRIILRSEDELEYVIDRLEELNSSLDRKMNISYEMQKMENVDWIESYKQSISPIEAGNFHIHPQWHEAKEGRINILINPALAFGSGHHATTYSCLLAIEECVNRGKRVLDVGCGSGILALAARKLGAEVELCDTDPLAIESARENFALNGEEYARIWEGSVSGSDGKYDVIVANIIADVLRAIALQLKERVAEGGYLILSGILDKKESIVTDSFKDLHPVKRIARDEWVTLIYKKDADGSAEQQR
jgi:ribosomal protein L11 methyltransferase